MAEDDDRTRGFAPADKEHPGGRHPSRGRASPADRISDHSIRLVVPKRRPADSLAEIAEYGDAATRAEALLARLDETVEGRARARILVEIAITLRDGESGRRRSSRGVARRPDER
jgi:hypothetical protein